MAARELRLCIPYIYSAVEANFTDNFSSDGVSAPAVQSAAKSAGVLFSCTFDDEASFTENWGVESFHSFDAAKWQWADKNSDEAEHGGLCMVGTDDAMTADDIDEWLYMRNKVTLKAGKATIRFQRKLVSWEMPILTVYYGESYTSADGGLTPIKEMTPDASNVSAWYTWNQENIEFDVSADGEYVLVFSLYMEASQYGTGAPFYLDNIEVIQEPVAEADILQVPLSFTFDDEASFTENWAVESFHSSDIAKWHWADKSADEADHGGLCIVGVDENLKTDINEWLYLRKKVALKAGKATLRFQRKLASWELPVLTVYYGETYTSKDAGLTSIKQMAADMSSVQQWQTWQQEEIEFNVAADGEYIFVFSLYMEGVGEASSSYSGAPFYLDNMEILQETEKEPEILEVPLKYTFADAASFTSDWGVDSKSGTDAVWHWTDKNDFNLAEEGHGGFLSSGNNTDNQEDANEWLYMRNKVSLKSGKATVSFDKKVGWSGTAENTVITVYYGKSYVSGADGLTKIGEISTAKGTWEQAKFEFNVPEEGNYIFVFNNYNSWQDLGPYYVDNIEINQEATAPEDRLDLVLDELVLPASSMTLSNAETIGVKVTNKGTVEITKMTLSYTVNGGTAVEQTFEEALASEASTTLTFTQKADFSTAGDYAIAVAVKSVEANTEATENPEGNTLNGSVTHLAPHTLPYSCTFETAAEFAEQWKVFNRSDAGGDAADWAWFDLIEHYQTPTTSFGDGPGGFVASKNNMGSDIAMGDNGNPILVPRKTANYMMTAVPFVLPSDKPITIGFQYRRAYGTGVVGSLKVYYSRTAEVGENEEGMTLIGSITVADGTEWHEGLLECNVSESGPYYLFFKHESEVPTNNVYLVLDNLSIKEGAFVGTPDLAVSRVELPLPSCGLGSAEPISVQVENRGTATISKFKLAYTVNDGTAVEQEFTQSLAPEAKATLVFDTKADFSTKTQYAVKVTGTVLESDGNDEENTDNNAATASVAYRAPAVLPFEADFTKNADERNKMAFAPNTWAYEAPRQGMTTATAAVLLSPCLPFEANTTYRIYLTYRSYIKHPDFDVLCGLANQPMAQWTTVKTYKAINTGGAYTTEVLEFHNGAQAGDYAVAVMPRNPEDGAYEGGLYVQSVKVDRKPDYDIRIMAIRSTVGAQTPVQHAAKPEFEILAKNCGEKNGTGITLEVKQGETLVGKSNPVNIAAGDSAYCTFPGQLTLSAAGEVALSVEAVLEGSAENMPGNVREWKFTATAEDYAFDNVALTAYTQHVGARNVPVGHIFTLAEADTLTAVTLGWANLTGNADGITEDFNVNVEVYPIDATDKAGACLLAYETERPLAGGVKTVAIPARVLAAGRYFIGVRQTNPLGSMALGCDNNPEGVLYLLDEGVASVQDGLGYAAVRAKFGKNPEVVGKDIEMLAISKPGERGAFAANEAIVASYRNNGCEAMEVEFKCTVSGGTKSKTVTVPAYSEGTVEFEADMSRPGAYGILVEAVAAGDEVAANNSVRKSVTCVEVDPYVMDFEHCADFSITNLLPWRTEDVDKTRTSGLDGYEWPHYGEPMGFMAFNPAEVSMATVAPAHGGDKFGLAISSIGKQNDDWLISPKLKMAAKDAAMSYYVRSYNVAYTETYEVLVSTTDDAVGSFSKVGETRTATDSWVKNEVDLSAYNGQEIYIAFRYTANDQFFFMIDDINVTKPTQGTETADLSDYVKSYPNPAADVWTVTAYGLAIDRVEICNLTGDVVYRSAKGLSAETYRLNVNGFTSGLYTARIYTNAGVQVLKLIVR